MQRNPSASQLTWDDVRAFLAVARAHRLGDAAAQLGFTASTLSRKVSTLERRVGGPLFERGREGVRLNARGEALVEPAELVEAAHAEFARRAAQREVEVEGVVRLSAPPGLADTFIVPALAGLLARHPKLRVELDVSMQKLNLTRQDADLAVRSVDSEGAQLVTQKLREARWVLAGSAELVGRLGTLKHWEDAPWISWDDALGARVGAARWLRTTVPHANRVLTTSHFAAQLAAAERGVGVVLLAEPYLSLRRLVRVPLHARLKPAAARWPVDRVWLVTHRTLRRVPRVAAVWDTLRDALLARGPEVW